MTFLSLEFFLVFFLFFALYWAFSFRSSFQNTLLLIASYALVFSFGASSVFVLFVYSLLTFFLSHYLVHYPKSKIGSVLIVLAVISLLFPFKYYDFFLQTIEYTFLSFGLSPELPVLKILIPIGISFYAFHSVSLLVSIQKRELTPLPFFDHLLYLSFFPSIVAGPINRARDFVPQLYPKTIREPLESRRAFLLITLSMIKLLLISSFLGEAFVNPVFNAPELAAPLQTLMAIYAYAFQIYCNFSGYTDLVTAIALLLGFRLPQNFYFPYLATNLSDFWRRWHISLSSFIRDYIYIPLGGNRKGFLNAQVYIVIAMILSGIWHGAGMTFLVWGMLHALGLIGSNFILKYTPIVPEFLSKFKLSRLLTFHYICFTWVFFRSASLESALLMLHSLLDLEAFQIGSSPLILSFFAFFVLYPTLVSSTSFLFDAFKKIPQAAFFISISLMLALAIFFSPPGVPDFIYARF